MDDKKPLHSGHRKRLTERFIKYSGSLSDHELLELILFYAIPRQNTNPIAHNLLLRFNSLQNVFEADILSLTSVEGVGEKTAVFLKTIGESILRVISSNEKQIKMFSFHTIKPYLLNYFKDCLDEKLVIFFLDNKGTVLSKLEDTSKNRAKVLTDTSYIAKAIASASPNFALLAHNHPSGNPNPTSADDIATGKINILCALHGVSLFDHVIVTKTDAYSYFASGRLDIIRQSFNIDKILTDTIDRLGE